MVLVVECAFAVVVLVSVSNLALFCVLIFSVSAAAGRKEEMNTTNHSRSTGTRRHVNVCLPVRLLQIGNGYDRLV